LPAKLRAGNIVEAYEQRAAKEVVAKHGELEILNQLGVDGRGDLRHGNEDRQVSTLTPLVHFEEQIFDGEIVEGTMM
jgi:hypothetical protein